MKARWKTFIFGVMAAFLSVFGTLIAAELLLRFLPYRQGLQAQAVTTDQPVFRFARNRNSTFSDDWNFNQVNRVRVNNDGFVNDADYDPEKKTPIIAIVGDSYIEAAMVPFQETVQGRLSSSLKDKGRAYSFAASGAGLSQYLVWARYARDKYRPDLFLISIIPNDFAESLHYREHSPGFWRFDRSVDGTFAWKLTEYRPSLIRRAMRHSALAMYLTQNVKVQNVLNFNIQNLGGDDRRWVGNVEAVSTDQQMNDFHWAVDRFLELLPSYTGVTVDRIMLSLDGFRPHMYGSDEDREFARRSTWGIMRNEMIQKATKLGMITIDLDPPMQQRYRRDRKRFEFPTNSHWNGLGHEVLSDAVIQTDAYLKLFGPVKDKIGN